MPPSRPPSRRLHLVGRVTSSCSEKGTAPAHYTSSSSRTWSLEFTTSEAHYSKNWRRLGSASAGMVWWSRHCSIASPLAWKDRPGASQSCQVCQGDSRPRFGFPVRVPNLPLHGVRAAGDIVRGNRDLRALFVPLVNLKRSRLNSHSLKRSNFSQKIYHRHFYEQTGDDNQIHEPKLYPPGHTPSRDGAAAGVASGRRAEPIPGGVGRGGSTVLCGWVNGWASVCACV